VVETAHAQWKIANMKEKQRRNGETFHVIQEMDVAKRCALTDLRPEVELVHLLRMRRHYFMFETDGIGQTPSWLERYLVKISILRHISLAVIHELIKLYNTKTIIVSVTRMIDYQ